MQTVIMGILIKDRIKESGRTLNILSQYASIISTRLGFHEVSQEVCSRVGFILLYLKGEESICQELYNKLQKIGGIEVQVMSFENN